MSYSVFVFSFSLFFVSVPCARLSSPPHQLLSARKFTASYRIVSYESRHLFGIRGVILCTVSFVTEAVVQNTEFPQFQRLYALQGKWLNTVDINYWRKDYLNIF